MNTYIKFIKSNNISNKSDTNYFLYKHVFNFINSYIDDEGYINFTDETNADLKKLILDILNQMNISHKTYIFKALEDYIFYELNKKVKYNEFFETIAMINKSDLSFEIISKILYEIYLYGTTVYTFSKYYEYNKDDFVYINKACLICADKKIFFSNNIFNNDFTATSYKLLILGHLKRKNGLIIESPINAYMRITLEFTKKINFINIGEIFDDIWLHRYYIPSTPMFYNSLKKKYNLLSSCFILDVEDNIESIGNLFKKILNILKFNSGIGINLSKLRSKNRPVMNNDTTSKGIFNYIKAISLLSEQFKNYSKKRNANINITLSIDHPDIISFLDLKLSTKAENGIPHTNLFQTISISDEFMYRYLKKIPWYLISPEQHIDNKHLYDVYGKEYSDLYKKMIADNTIEKIEIDPSLLMNKIVNTMIQTGGPFLFYKDTVNETSNFDEIINATNLCTEILIPSSNNETACCNIMSLNLKKFIIIHDNSDRNDINIKKQKKERITYEFDFNKFEMCVSKIVILLNNVISNTYYSDISCYTSNMKYKPMGIGIQGLADTIETMEKSYLEGKNLYHLIIERLYYSALKQSNLLAQYNPEQAKYKNYEFVYKKFIRYQSNKIDTLKSLSLDNLTKQINLNDYEPKSAGWSELNLNIAKYGLINSLFVALMPTSLSSGIYNNSESFEPYMNIMYKKQYYEYDILCYDNVFMDRLLSEKNFYINPQTVIKMLNVCDCNINKLGLSNIDYSYFKTFKNISIKEYIDFNKGIDSFVDQGISFNISVKDNCNATIIKSLIQLWLYGKKTIYYYRTDIRVNPLMFDDNIKNRLEKIYSINCNTCQ